MHSNIMEYFCLFDVSFIFFCLRVEKNPQIIMGRSVFSSLTILIKVLIFDNMKNKPTVSLAKDSGSFVQGALYFRYRGSNMFGFRGCF